MTIDFKAAALAARRASAAYIESRWAAANAFEALGDTFVDQYQNASHQAYITVDGAGRTQLSISGTRASQGALADVFDDVDLAPFNMALGGAVARGCWEGMADLWQWVHDTVDANAVIDVQGHSLGAARTHLSPVFRDPAHIGALHAFESPKFADTAFYSRFAAPLAGMVCTLNGRDMWAAWPWLGDAYSRPQVPHVWLTQGPYAVIDPAAWTGPHTSNDDHDIDLVAQRLNAIAQSA